MHNSLESTCTFLVQASSHLGLLDALETHEDHVLISVWEMQKPQVWRNPSAESFRIRYQQGRLTSHIKRERCQHAGAYP